MSKAVIYRLECRICESEHDSIRPGLPKGWTHPERIRSLRESRRVTPRPGEIQFSLLDWQTHYGVCPTCNERMLEQLTSEENQQEWIEENQIF